MTAFFNFSLALTQQSQPSHQRLQGSLQDKDSGHVYAYICGPQSCCPKGGKEEAVNVSKQSQYIYFQWTAQHRCFQTNGIIFGVVLSISLAH